MGGFTKVDSVLLNRHGGGRLGLLSALDTNSDRESTEEKNSQQEFSLSFFSFLFFFFAALRFMLKVEVSQVD